MAVSCSKGSRRAVLMCSPFAKEKCPAKHGTATDVTATGACSFLEPAKQSCLLCTA